MSTDDTGTVSGLSPRARAFYAARNEVIRECRRRQAELETELTDRLKAMRAEYEAATVPQEVADALTRAQDRAAQAEARWYADGTLTPWQRREISDAAARTPEAERALDDYYRLTED